MSPTWVLDLDNTLYPAGSPLFDHVNRRIDRFLTEELGLPGERAARLREAYRRRFGVTLGGLIAEHGVDPEVYLAYVHDVPVARYLDPDPELAGALDAVGGRKVVFTNGSTAHARAVLERLGIAGRVDGIYDIGFMGYVPKPFPAGYRKLLAALGEPARRCWLVDDLVANLDTGRALGMRTALVGPAPADGHRHLRRAADLPLLARHCVDTAPAAP